MTQYSRRQLKRALRTKIVTHDMPKWIHDEIDRQRKKMNREAATMHKEMDKFMLEEMKLKKPRPWISGKQLRLVVALKNRLNRTPGWMVKFREFMLDIFWDY